MQLLKFLPCVQEILDTLRNTNRLEYEGTSFQDEDCTFYIDASMTSQFDGHKEYRVSPEFVCKVMNKLNEICASESTLHVNYELITHIGISTEAPYQKLNELDVEEYLFGKQYL
jgi:hypothetical protein